MKSQAVLLAVHGCPLMSLTSIDANPPTITDTHGRHRTANDGGKMVGRMNAWSTSSGTRARDDFDTETERAFAQYLDSRQLPYVREPEIGGVHPDRHRRRPVRERGDRCGPGLMVRRRIVVFLGDRAQRRGDVEPLPLRSFLSELPG